MLLLTAQQLLLGGDRMDSRVLYTHGFLPAPQRAAGRELEMEEQIHSMLGAGCCGSHPPTEGTALPSCALLSQDRDAHQHSLMLCQADAVCSESLKCSQMEGRGSESPMLAQSL